MFEVRRGFTRIGCSLLVLATICGLVALTWSSAAAPKDLTSFSFDHFTTGFPLTGAHRTVPCESCHVVGQFEGTPRRCSACHNGGRASDRPAGHVRTTDSCDSCHSSMSFSPARVDHGQVLGTCISCHDGRSAIGKSAGHVTSGDACADCHNTASFAIARFDHSTVSGHCVSCHDGRTATGKPSGHIASTNTCDDCHATTSWQSVRFDHSAVTGSCVSCHDGRKANRLAESAAELVLDD